MRRIILRGAHVVTMAPDRPDAEMVDILIEGDRIKELGTGIEPDDAEVVDLVDRIVLPGLINAHLHTWQTALRFVGADWSLPEYLAKAHGGVARHYRPEDMYIGTLAGALNQIDCGVTTIGDWCHNCATSDHADAAVDALKAAGIRAIFLHGTPHGLLDREHDVREVDRLLNGPLANSDLLSVGMAVKGPQLSKPDVALADLRAAAERNILASMHQSAGSPGHGWQAVDREGLWGPLTNIAHGSGLSDRWVKRLVKSGVTFTSTPENELGQGHCTQITQRLLAAGRAPSLGTDTEVVSGGEVLIAARITLAQQRGLIHARAHIETGLGSPEPTITVKHALSWATTEGARALGLADRIGHIAAGMQADLVVIDKRSLSLSPAHNPLATALFAHAADIEAVMIAGTWLKRAHRLLFADVDSIKEDLRRSGTRLAGEVVSPGPIARARGRVVSRVVTRQLRKQAELDSWQQPDPGRAGRSGRGDRLQ